MAMLIAVRTAISEKRAVMTNLAQRRDRVLSVLLLSLQLITAVCD